MPAVERGECLPFVDRFDLVVELEIAFSAPIAADSRRQVPIAAERSRVCRRVSAPIGSWGQRVSAAIGGNRRQSRRDVPAPLLRLRG